MASAPAFTAAISSADSSTNTASPHEPALRTPHGLLPVVLSQEQVRELMLRDEITVDLKSRTVDAFPFELDDFSRTCLLEGLDDIALTLREADAIAAYEASHPVPLTTIAT